METSTPHSPTPRNAISNSRSSSLLSKLLFFSHPPFPSSMFSQFLLRMSISQPERMAVKGGGSRSFPRPETQERPRLIGSTWSCVPTSLLSFGLFLRDMGSFAINSLPRNLSLSLLFSGDTLTHSLTHSAAWTHPLYSLVQGCQNVSGMSGHVQADRELTTALCVCIRCTAYTRNVFQHGCVVDLESPGNY